MTENIKIPIWYWGVAGIALLWNLVGVYVFYIQITASPEWLASLSEVRRAMVAAYPIWFNIAFGVSVVGGTLGCIALLFKKEFAVPLFITSSIGVLAQMVYSYILIDNQGGYGSSDHSMSIKVVVISISLMIYSHRAEAKGWLS